MMKWIVVALALLALSAQAQAGPVGSRFQANTYKTDRQYAPAVAPLTSGGFVATWMSMDQDGSVTGIYARLYDAMGVPIGNEFRVNTYTAGQQGSPSVAALNDGGFVVTWHSQYQDGNGYGVYGQRYDATGRRKAGEFRINKTTFGDQQCAMVAGLSDGGFVVVWLSYAGSSQDLSKADVRGQRYNAAGTRVGIEFKVGEREENGFFSPPHVGKLAQGGFVVTWVSQTVTANSVFAQRYKADGTAAGSRVKVTTTLTPQTRGLTDPQIAGLKNGYFVIVWSDWNNTVSKAGTFAQLYASNGDVFGAKFQANTVPRSAQSAVAPLATGGFVVVYSAIPDLNWIVSGQRFGANGRRIGTEFNVGPPENLADGQTDPSVAGLGGGGFVLLWTGDETQILDFDGIFGQRYNP